MNEKTLDSFCAINPFSFSNEQLEKLKNDMKHPKKRLICDERVDFLLWCKYGLSRQDYFAEFVSTLFSKEKYPFLLEVGCGYNARLSILLSEKGYHMSAIDPKVNETINNKITLVPTSFDYTTTDISSYSAIIAQEPCDGTEHIIRACIKEKKDFIIALCGVPHALINGTIPNNCDEWYSYLVNLDHEHIFLLKHLPFIPNINSNILIGMFHPFSKE